MSRKTKTKKTTLEEREELLERLWIAVTRKITEKIETCSPEDLDGATVQAANKILAENGITAESLNKDHTNKGRSLAEAARTLPSFDEDTPTSDDALDIALRTPAPIPPMTEETVQALKRLEEDN